MRASTSSSLVAQLVARRMATRPSSIHCQSSGCMALAFSKSKLAERRPWLKILAWGWAGLICVSTLFTKQHSVIDVVCGLALTAVWYWPLYGRRRTGVKGGI